MGWLTMLAAALLAAVNVRVTTLDGEIVTGQLSQLDDAGVRLQGEAATQIPLDRVLSIEQVEPVSVSATGASVGLRGGSRVAVDALTSSESIIELAVRGGDPLKLPLKQLLWVRFRGASPAVDPQWLGLVEKQRVSDSLVIRRPGDAIDQVEGVVLGIGAESVSFSLDGDTMQAPVARLEGLLLGGAESAKPQNAASPAIVLEDVHGSRWIATSLGQGGDMKVRLQLSEEAFYELPLDAIRKVELRGAIEFLAALPPVESGYTPYVSIGLPKELLSDWLGPQTLEDRDLVLRSTSHVEYRVSEGFQTLVGSVAWAPEVTAGGDCVVRVLLDSKIAWEQTLDVSDPEPRGFELPLGGVRRVRFEVASGNGGDLGDTVRFRQPRMLK